jgi:CHC2 zinc finger
MRKSLREEKTLNIATYGTPCYGSVEEKNSKNPLDRVLGKRPKTARKGGSMARIAEEEIERLKREVSLERLAEARGVRLKRHGADLIGLCPFHDDHSPSLVISPKKNLCSSCERALAAEAEEEE